MKKTSTLLIVLLVSLSLVLVPSAFAKKPKPPPKPGNKGTASISYTLGDGTPTPLTVNLEEKGGLTTGIVEISDDGSVLHFKFTVWSKPCLAYGEKDLDNNPKDNVMDDQTPPYKGDKTDIGSDGAWIIIGLDEWEWKTNGDKNAMEMDCEKFTDYTDGDGPTWQDWGIWKTPIEYLADIPINGDWGSTFNINLELHASPPIDQKFWIPEFPFGTLSALIVSIVAIGLFTRMRKNSMSVPILS